MKRRPRPSALALVVLGLALSSCNGSSPSSSPAPAVPPPSVTIGLPQLTPISPPVLPHPIEALKQGGRYWGVYVAVAPMNSPKLEAAREQLAGVGVAVAPTSLGCDQGAAQELGVVDDGSLGGVAAYFASKAEADAFAGALDPPPVGVAHVQVFCAD